MPDYEKLKELALSLGFANAGPLDPSTLIFMPEVRDMCASNKCNRYNKSWACPPACGTLDEMRERIQGFSYGLIVQTVGELEDSLDWEGMQAAAQLQEKLVPLMEAELEKQYPRVLTMGTGTCVRCKTCTYPDAPCRFPDKLFASMEACGLNVSKTCVDNNIPYNYGPNKIAYTACFLLE